MNRRALTAISLALLAVGFVIVTTNDVAGQRHKRRAAPATKVVTVDYSRFLHGKEHLQDRKGAEVACNTCHKIPTGNSQQLRGFPDVTDYPGHDACVGCHRKQFFVGARPPVCANCHTVISPDKGTRFDFPRLPRPPEFRIEFPHGKHQDVIALLNKRKKFFDQARGERVSLVAFAHVADDRKPGYNNCTVCHSQNVIKPAGAHEKWVDGYFKTIPERHSACFSCHWSGTKPTSDQCEGCHKPGVPLLRERQSAKFNHEGGGDGKDKSHPAECTKCHINITKPSIVTGRTPDVPITSCASCHNQKPTPGAEPVKCSEPENFRGAHIILDELGCLKTNKTFSCAYCHDSKIGQREAPASHFLVTGIDQFARKDLP
jgi:hypothetical protein